MWYVCFDISSSILFFSQFLLWLWSIRSQEFYKCTLQHCWQSKYNDTFWMTFVAAMQMWESIWDIQLQWSEILYSGDLRKKLWASLALSLFSYTFHFADNRRIRANTLTIHNRSQQITKKQKKMQTVRKKNRQLNKISMQHKNLCSHWNERNACNDIARKHFDNCFKRLFSTIFFNTIHRHTGISVWWWSWCNEW